MNGNFISDAGDDVWPLGEFLLQFRFDYDYDICQSYQLIQMWMRVVLVGISSFVW